MAGRILCSMLYIKSTLYPQGGISRLFRGMFPAGLVAAGLVCNVSVMIYSHDRMAGWHRLATGTLQGGLAMGLVLLGEQRRTK